MASQTGNRLLDFLPADVVAPLTAVSQSVSLAHGQEIYPSNGAMPYVYFPTTSIVGIVLVFEDGKQVEAKTVAGKG